MATKKVNSVRSHNVVQSDSAYGHAAPALQPRPLSVAVGFALLPWALVSAAGQPAPTTTPQNGRYVYGTGVVNPVQSGNFVSGGRSYDVKLQITQTSQNGTIDFDSYSLGEKAWVNYTQPSSSSITLNRVLGNDPSQIFGRISANGKIFLSNQNGVLFAPSASVDVGALFATTLRVADQDALAGIYNKWRNPGNSGAVVNQGSITVDSYAALVGPQVRNDGVIVAHAGSVTLAAGDAVSLDMLGDGLIKVTVDEAALNASAINAGTIEADGGNVLLTARSANALLDTVVNNSGVIRANSLVERNGEIVLDGGSTGVVANTGTLSAAGVDAGTTGGTVKVLGQYVGLFNGSRVDVSGEAGGGNAFIGGNFHGAGPEQNAARTFIGSDASIKADAITSGDGGHVAVWSDNGTQFYGSISARGGAQGGNGGFVEVSGKKYLAFNGSVDTRAPRGRTGMLLLDPNNLEIVDDNGVNTENALDSSGAPAAFTTAGDSSRIFNTTIQTALSGTDVTVATGSAGANTESGDILVSANVIAHTGHALKLQADGSISGPGTLDVDQLALVAGTNINVTTAVDTVAANAGGTVNISNTAPSGTLTVGTVMGVAGITGNGVVLTEQGSLTVIDAISGGAGAVTLKFGAADTGAVFTGGASITGSAVNINGGGGDDTFDLTGSTPAASLDGGGGSDTLKLSNATWDLDDAVQDKGSSGGTLTWIGIGNLFDTGAGTFNMGIGGAVSGSITATTGTLDYSNYSTGIAVDLTASTASGIGTTYNGISTINANAAKTNTIGGTSETYSLTDGTPNAGSNGSVSWTNFQNISDTGGTVNFNASGSVTGNVTADTLDYTGYGQDLTLNISNGVITTDGVTGTLAYNTVNANAAQNNTVTGTAATYSLTNGTPDAGTGGGKTWTNFQNISDA
ncbi:MAG TPA: filamentous hemagglutinin N-terminal domain-containing protein, partial [Burkholderiales bacterium]|nr:filamentous hemagglutinin N-terminal domain-containing protein [Burkholderiales bacterium]